MKHKCCIFKLLLKLIGAVVALYGVVFAVFFFDLDSKLIYRVVMPLLNKWYEKQDHKDITKTPYGTKVESILK